MDRVTTRLMTANQLNPSLVDEDEAVAVAVGMAGVVEGMAADEVAVGQTIHELSVLTPRVNRIRYASNAQSDLLL